MSAVLVASWRKRQCQKYMGDTLLMDAASSDQAKIVTYLLAKGADVNAVSQPFALEPVNTDATFLKHHITVMIKPVSSTPNSPDSLQFGTPTKSGAKTALMYAALSGHAAMARLLLDHGAHINTTDDNGKTALIYACMFVRVDVVRPAPSSSPVEGTPYACMFVRVDVVRLLLSRHARTDIQDKQGFTALKMVTATTDSPDLRQGYDKIIPMLKQYGTTQ